MKTQDEITFKIKTLENKVSSLENSISIMKKDIWGLLNPPKFNKGDIVEISEEAYTNKGKQGIIINDPELMKSSNYIIYYPPTPDYYWKYFVMIDYETTEYFESSLSKVDEDPLNTEI